VPVPRVKRTPTGGVAQPVQAIRGQEYGRGVEQERLQSAMPAPQSQPIKAPTQSPEPASEEQLATSPRPSLDMAQLQQLLRGAGGLLNSPDDRPDIPFTETLNNPSAMMRMNAMPSVNRTGETMRELSRRTGDPTFADLAARAGI
jgi:predicted component of type VI protein secretion system